MAGFVEICVRPTSHMSRLRVAVSAMAPGYVQDIIGSDGFVREAAALGWPAAPVLPIKRQRLSLTAGRRRSRQLRDMGLPFQH